MSSVVNSSGLNMGCVGTKPDQDPIGKSVGNDDNRNLTTHYSKDPTTGNKDVSIMEFSVVFKKKSFRVIPDHDFYWKSAELRWAKPSVLVVSAYFVPSHIVLPLS